jgi:hypothetical protein
METFDEFYKSIKELADSFAKKGLLLKIEQNPDHSIIKIFGEDVSSVERAKHGLGDVTELAYTTAEHHPYWNLLYSCCQISDIILEKWDGDLTKEDLDEISWLTDELKNTTKKLKDAHN